MPLPSHTRACNLSTHTHTLAPPSRSLSLSLSLSLLPLLPPPSSLPPPPPPPPGNCITTTLLCLTRIFPSCQACKFCWLFSLLLDRRADRLIFIHSDAGSNALRAIPTELFQISTLETLIVNHNRVFLNLPLLFFF